MVVIQQEMDNPGKNKIFKPNKVAGIVKQWLIATRKNQRKMCAFIHSGYGNFI
jgi:hypothetical protein